MARVLQQRQMLIFALEVATLVPWAMELKKEKGVRRMNYTFMLMVNAKADISAAPT